MGLRFLVRAYLWCLYEDSCFYANVDQDPLNPPLRLHFSTPHYCQWREHQSNGPYYYKTGGIGWRNELL